MKVGICSDSHDHLPNLRKLMLEYARRKADAIIHAGDFVAPFTIDAMKLARCKVYAVFGNNDGERRGLTQRFTEIGEVWREPHIFEFGNLKFVVMHHPDWINAFADPKLADVIVYGHLHELTIENRPPLIINPGEVFGGLTKGPDCHLVRHRNRYPGSDPHKQSAR